MEKVSASTMKIEDMLDLPVLEVGWTLLYQWFDLVPDVAFLNNFEFLNILAS